MDTTKLNQIEKNLLVFLDPVGNKSMEDWQFIRAEEVGVKYFFKNDKDSRDENILYSFPRRQLWKYFLFLLNMQWRGDSGRFRRFLYINDGILSSLFETINRVGYHSFAKRHLPKPEKLWEKIARFASLMLRAEQIFIVKYIKYNNNSIDLKGYNDVKNMDYMFFSNVSGKIILTCSDNFNLNKGVLLKTTANPDYVKVMEKEYEIISKLSFLLCESNLIPAIGNNFLINGRYCYMEDYIYGNSMLKILRDLGRKGDVGTFVEQIEKLDHWYKCYVSIFKGDKKPITQIYEPIVNTFSDIYCMNVNTKPIIKRVTDILSEIEKCHHGFECVVSHNDLWPGNFICNEERLTAVDWERATAKRAPIFDYYWMLISAVLTYLLGENKHNDYTLVFRDFFMSNHVCCVFVHNKLKLFLRNFDISEKFHNDILLLFLLELSVQGYTVLGKQTGMDKIAADELIFIINRSTL